MIARAKPPTTTINLNAPCRVKLRKRGVEVLRQHYAELGLSDLCQKTHPNLRTGYVLETVLWDVMSIFGSSIHLGCIEPIDMDIEIQTEF